MLGLEPGYFADRYGIRFQEDDRGSTAALLQTEPGRHQYMLLRHFDSPSPGTEVLASEHSPRPKQDLAEFLDAMELGDEIVTWKIGDDSSVTAGR